MSSSRGRVLLDAQLLVLLVVGGTSRRYIARHKRLDHYTAADFDALIGLVHPLDRLVVTPNVLSEASNLLRHIREPARTEIFGVFREFIQSTSETYVPSGAAATHPAFLRLGLADVVCLSAEVADVGLLTADNELYLAALRGGRDVLNFWHLRQATR